MIGDKDGISRELVNREELLDYINRVDDWESLQPEFLGELETREPVPQWEEKPKLEARWEEQCRVTGEHITFDEWLSNKPEEGIIPNLTDYNL